MIKMRKTLFILLFLMMFSLAQIPKVKADTSFNYWVKTYGGSGDDRITDIKVLPDGSMIMVGSTTSFGAGDRDVWVLRLDKNGNVKWQKTYGGSKRDWASAVALAPNGDVIVAGVTDSFGAGGDDVWVLRLDANGNVKWQKTYGGSKWDEANAVALAPNGDIIVAGHTGSFGASWYDVWVLRLDENGNVKWQKTYGGSDWDKANAVAVAKNGDIIVAGQTGSSYSNIWVLRLDENGNVKWQKTYGRSSGDVANSVAITPNGDIIVAGETYGFGGDGKDAWILRLDSKGNVKWQKIYGGRYWDEAYAVAIAPNGDVIIAGSTGRSGAGDSDVWVLRLDSEGNVKWQKTYGGGSDDEANAVALAPNGDIIVAGYTYSFGAGRSDVWVLRLPEDGLIFGFSKNSNAQVKEHIIQVNNTNAKGVYSKARITNSQALEWMSTATIKIVVSPGILKVSSDPSGAKIYINNEYQGVTPFIMPVIPKTYTVKLVRAPYYYNTTVTIASGEVKEINATLTQPGGTLEISSNPPRARIYIDGEYKGMTPMTVKLVSGHHSVKITKEKYQNYTTEVMLDPGEAKIITVKLSPVYSYLTVKSTPPGAKVYVDGSYAGKTPLRDYKLSPGSHEIKMVKEGYKEFTKTITLTAAEKTSLVASLVALVTTSTSTQIQKSSTTSNEGHAKVSSTAIQTKAPVTSSTLAIINPITAGGISIFDILGGLLLLGLIGGVAAKVRGGKPKPSGGTAKPAPTPTKKPVPGFPPELLSKYEPLEFLGEGGFAKVFKVKRKKDNKIIALKISRLDKKAKKFFLKEIKAWQLLRHKNIVKLYKAFAEPIPHLEIEFVDGIRLDDETIRDIGKYPKPVDEEKALHFIKGIARGLKHAHSRQVYHRDLKPQNVLITRDLTPKITDWGLAKVGALSTTATTTKGLTLLYAAPEQLDDEEYGHTDNRTDIYQLGLIFYELLTGKLPYQGTSPAVVMAKVINPEVKPKPPSHFNKEFSKYDGIFEKLLAKKKEDRYQSVEEFLKDLELLRKLEKEKSRLTKEIEKTKTTISLTTDSRELRKLRRQLVEQLSRNALLLARLNDKAELINALEDLKAFSKEHRNELEGAISQFELMMRESVPISKSTLEELKVLLHKVEREVK